jgi:hypothetical protein
MMANPRQADERHVSLYGDRLGNWLLMTTATGTIPPPVITLCVYDGPPPPPSRTLVYLGEPGDLVITLYQKMGGTGFGGRAAEPVQQRLAVLLGVGQTAVSRYIRQLSRPELSDRGWRNLVQAALRD